jgi:hypothetical protein
MNQLAALARQVPQSAFLDLEKRTSTRHPCKQEAVSQPLDSPGTMAWGATVQNISAAGMGVVLCFPFKPGSHLAVTLHTSEVRRTLLVRVVHALDQADGTWFLGCEFVQQLQAEEIEEICHASKSVRCQ